MVMVKEKATACMPVESAEFIVAEQEVKEMVKEKATACMPVESAEFIVAEQEVKEMAKEMAKEDANVPLPLIINLLRNTG
jgi:proteasome lid subunit RPN8/RPN11